MTRSGSGLILGKFLPPHQGHVYLIDFARNYCENLTVVLGSIVREPIPGAVRAAWLRELFPDVRIFHLTDENPQYPGEHPDFWDLWEASLRKAVPDGVDYVFASESYGYPLAKRLGAEYVPVDQARELVPVSASLIRAEPLRFWRYLPAPVRPWYVKRIAIVGPESVGKSTLTRLLADHFGTSYVHEYARGMIVAQDNRFGYEDYARIARGQVAAEEAMALRANRVLFCDTDLLITTLWADYFHGGCPDWIHRQAEARHYDHYLLLAPDTPWVDDQQRYQSDQDERDLFFNKMQANLDRLRREYTIIHGAWEERFEAATKVIRSRFGDWS